MGAKGSTERRHDGNGCPIYTRVAAWQHAGYDEIARPGCKGGRQATP